MTALVTIPATCSAVSQVGVRRFLVNANVVPVAVSAYAWLPLTPPSPKTDESRARSTWAARSSNSSPARSESRRSRPRRSSHSGDLAQPFRRDQAHTVDLAQQRGVHARHGPGSEGAAGGDVGAAYAGTIGMSAVRSGPSSGSASPRALAEHLLAAFGVLQLCHPALLGRRDGEKELSATPSGPATSVCKASRSAFRWPAMISPTMYPR